jgi:hypothetical protein
MASDQTGLVKSMLDKFLPGLSFPKLFLLFLALFVLDLFMLDPLPFVDEIGLALLTLMLGSFRSRGDKQQAAGLSAKPPEKNVTPRSQGPEGS